MIRTEDHHDTIILHAKETYPVCEVLNFLASRGYEIRSYLQKFPAEKGFLIDEPATEIWTFTATKRGEEQSHHNVFTRVFEREVKECLRNFMKI